MPLYRPINTYIGAVAAINKIVNAFHLLINNALN